MPETSQAVLWDRGMGPGDPYNEDRYPLIPLLIKGGNGNHPINHTVFVSGKTHPKKKGDGPFKIGTP